MFDVDEREHLNQTNLRFIYKFNQQIFFNNLRHISFHYTTDTVHQQTKHPNTKIETNTKLRLLVLRMPSRLCAGAKLTVSHCSVVSRLNIKAVSVEAPAAISLGANPISVVHKVEIQKVCIPGSAKSLPLIKTALFKRLT